MCPTLPRPFGGDRRAVTSTVQAIVLVALVTVTMAGVGYLVLGVVLVDDSPDVEQVKLRVSADGVTVTPMVGDRLPAEATELTVRRIGPDGARVTVDSVGRASRAAHVAPHVSVSQRVAASGDRDELRSLSGEGDPRERFGGRTRNVSASAVVAGVQSNVGADAADPARAEWKSGQPFHVETTAGFIETGDVLNVKLADRKHRELLVDHEVRVTELPTTIIVAVDPSGGDGTDPVPSGSGGDDAGVDRSTSGGVVDVGDEWERSGGDGSLDAANPVVARAASGGGGVPAATGGSGQGAGPGDGGSAGGGGVGDGGSGGSGSGAGDGGAGEGGGAGDRGSGGGTGDGGVGDGSTVVDVDGPDTDVPGTGGGGPGDSSGSGSAGDGGADGGTSGGTTPSTTGSVTTSTGDGGGGETTVDTVTFLRGDKRGVASRAQGTVFNQNGGDVIMNRPDGSKVVVLTEQKWSELAEEGQTSLKFSEMPEEQARRFQAYTGGAENPVKDNTWTGPADEPEVDKSTAGTGASKIGSGSGDSNTDATASYGNSVVDNMFDGTPPSPDASNEVDASSGTGAGSAGGVDAGGGKSNPDATDNYGDSVANDMFDGTPPSPDASNEVDASSGTDAGDAGDVDAGGSGTEIDTGEVDIDASDIGIDVSTIDIDITV